jgi:hypothetical protein
LLVALLVCGCATSSASTVGYFSSMPGDHVTGVVIGKVGFGGHSGGNLLWASFVAVDGEGNRWKIPLEPSLSQDDGATAPFLVKLPAGRYRLLSLSMEYPNTVWTMDDMELSLEVEAGRVACAGAAYLRGSSIQESGNSKLAPRWHVRHECDELGKVLWTHSPSMSRDLVVRLFAPQVHAN